MEQISMNRDTYHSLGSSPDSYVIPDGYNQSQKMSDFSQSETRSGTDTASLLKSFIKENLRGSHESTGGASSSDESADLELLRQDVASGVNVSRNDTVTPEPQPLTRSNVTLHDGIWRTDINDDEQLSPSQRNKPISLSPPLKGLRIPQESDGSRKPWERVMLEHSLSDAESDQSYSSQDTMILKKTEDAARDHLKYLDMYESTKASGKNNLLPITSKRPIGLVRPHDYLNRRELSDPYGPSTSGLQSRERGAPPSRRVRFASDVQFQEHDAENDSFPGPAHRSLNVDYSLMLARSNNGDHPDQDDGYESTDNASSTSSSSNGADPNAGGLQPEDPRVSPNVQLGATGGTLKTDYGYVDRSKMPSFRKMNMELRRRAVTKSAENTVKNTVEDKLRALCIDTTEENEQTDVNVDPALQSPSGSNDQSGSFDFKPRDASSPLLLNHNQAVASNQDVVYSIGGLDNIGSEIRSCVQPNPTEQHQLYDQDYSTVQQASNDYDMQYGSSDNNHTMDYTDGDDTYRPASDFSWDRKSSASIPDQPRRPAPILRDNSKAPGLSSSTGNINAIYSERTVVPASQPMSDMYPLTQQQNVNSTPRPMSEIYISTRPVDDVYGSNRPMSEMYSSQPELLSNPDPSVQNLGAMSNKFKSEPLLQKGDTYGSQASVGNNSAKNTDYNDYGQVYPSRYQPTDSYGTIPRARQSPVQVDNNYQYENRHRPPSPAGSQYSSYSQHTRPRSPTLHLNNSQHRALSPVRQASLSRSLSSERIDNAIEADRTFPRQTSFAKMDSGSLYTNQYHNNPPKQQNTLTNSSQNMEPCDIPGVLVYRSNSTMTMTPQVQPTISDENLNTSGSTGSSDSGIDHASIDSSKVPPQPLYPSESRGRRAPVNYTLDDTSRDPMGLVEKVKRRREASPVRRAFTDTPPLSKNPEKSSSKNSLLCQPGEFTTPTSKDLSRMRNHQRGVAPGGGKVQPMKALPIHNGDQGWEEKLDGNAAKKVLDSQSSKMKDEYSRYLQLYAKFQRDNSQSTQLDQNPEENRNKRRPSSPDSLSSSSGYADNSSYGSRGEMYIDHDSSSDSYPQWSSSPTTPTTEVKYMRTADIYKMFAEQREPQRVSRSQLSSPTGPNTPALSSNETDDSKRANSLQDPHYGGTGWSNSNGNSSFESAHDPIHSGYNQRASSIVQQGYNPESVIGQSSRHDPMYGDYNREPNLPVQQGYRDKSSRQSLEQSPAGGSTKHATNADIYSLYTGSAQQRHRTALADTGINKTVHYPH